MASGRITTAEQSATMGSVDENRPTSNGGNIAVGTLRAGGGLSLGKPGSRNGPPPKLSIAAGPKPGGLQGMLKKKLGRAGNIFAGMVMTISPVEAAGGRVMSGEIADADIPGFESMSEEELEAAKEKKRQHRRMVRKMRRAEKRLMLVRRDLVFSPSPRELTEALEG